MKMKLLMCAVVLAAGVVHAGAFNGQLKKMTGVDVAAKASAGDIKLPEAYGYLEKAKVVAGADGGVAEIRCENKFPAAHSQEAVVVAAEAILKKIQSDFSVAGCDTTGGDVWGRAIRFSDSSWTARLTVTKDAAGGWLLALVFAK